MQVTYNHAFCRYIIVRTLSGTEQNPQNHKQALWSPADISGPLLKKGAWENAATSNIMPQIGSPNTVAAASQQLVTIQQSNSISINRPDERVKPGEYFSEASWGIVIASPLVHAASNSPRDANPHNSGLSLAASSKKSYKRKTNNNQESAAGVELQRTHEQDIIRGLSSSSSSSRYNRSSAFPSWLCGLLGSVITCKKRAASLASGSPSPWGRGMKTWRRNHHSHSTDSNSISADRHLLILAVDNKEIRDLWWQALLQATMSRPELILWVHKCLADVSSQHPSHEHQHNDAENQPGHYPIHGKEVDSTGNDPNGLVVNPAPYDMDASSNQQMIFSEEEVASGNWAPPHGSNSRSIRATAEEPPQTMMTEGRVLPLSQQRQDSQHVLVTSLPHLSTGLSAHQLPNSSPWYHALLACLTICVGKQQQQQQQQQENQEVPHYNLLTQPLDHVPSLHPESPCADMEKVIQGEAHGAFNSSSIDSRRPIRNRRDVVSSNPPHYHRPSSTQSRSTRVGTTKNVSFQMVPVLKATTGDHQVLMMNPAVAEVQPPLDFAAHDTSWQTTTHSSGHSFAAALHSPRLPSVAEEEDGVDDDAASEAESGEELQTQHVVTNLCYSDKKQYTGTTSTSSQRSLLERAGRPKGSSLPSALSFNAPQSVSAYSVTESENRGDPFFASCSSLAGPAVRQQLPHSLTLPHHQQAGACSGIINNYSQDSSLPPQVPHVQQHHLFQQAVGDQPWHKYQNSEHQLRNTSSPWWDHASVEYQTGDTCSTDQLGQHAMAQCNHSQQPIHVHAHGSTSRAMHEHSVLSLRANEELFPHAHVPAFPNEGHSASQALHITTHQQAQQRRVDEGQCTEQAGLSSSAAVSGVITGHPRVIAGHPRVIAGHPRVITGHPRVITGHPRVISGHPRSHSRTAEVEDTIRHVSSVAEDTRFQEWLSTSFVLSTAVPESGYFKEDIIHRTAESAPHRAASDAGSIEGSTAGSSRGSEETSIYIGSDEGFIVAGRVSGTNVLTADRSLTAITSDVGSKWKEELFTAAEVARRLSSRLQDHVQSGLDSAEAFAPPTYGLEKDQLLAEVQHLRSTVQTVQQQLADMDARRQLSVAAMDSAIRSLQQTSQRVISRRAASVLQGSGALLFRGEDPPARHLEDDMSSNQWGGRLINHGRGTALGSQENQVQAGVTVHTSNTHHHQDQSMDGASTDCRKVGSSAHGSLSSTLMSLPLVPSSLQLCEVSPVHTPCNSHQPALSTSSILS
ncbi:hypothetical protein CEUSTIGMA_g4280.t1 [Chlamydomonas eustigma]|uniref:Uncharacterized protein n=1 Tax=Chlamydomonas eustigma TaxID=1157962 RepID=A0A250X158_9CHLO|nr:hypothetical protein CEUSTIGMA_g4280.t1 [Chlamydomonas eustigma]|eukprot:GAX76834.1 hypothetical protein CEUSTIGMA_g4280.t1 [Chlamydomonas eustigma]